MPLESGSVSCRLFYLPRPLPPGCVDRFAAAAAPPLDTLGSGAVTGWVTGRHLLDRVITEDNAFLAGYLRLTLMKAERKIPPALLRAECRMAELTELQARGAAFLKRTERAEIKREVIDRLLPQMPPTLTGIDMAGDVQGESLVATAVSEAQVEAFSLQFRNTTGCDIIPLTAGTIAARHRSLDVRNLPPSSFSPEVEDAEAGNHTGHEFLTWLWFMSEARGGSVELDTTSVAILVEGPLTFIFEGGGAHEASLRRGAPEISVEAKSALLGGKKLRRAKLTLACRDQNWNFTLDAESFALRGLKLPKSENLDSISRFQERMLSILGLQTILEQLYLRYLDTRTDAAAWRAVQTDIHRWVETRLAKR